jgi:hypothetical protein
MQRSLAIFVALLFLGMFFLVGGVVLASRLIPESRRRRTLKPLLIWFGKGVVLPALLWAIMNVGVSLELQPFIPEVQAMKNEGGPWFAEFLHFFGDGFFVIASYWAAGTLGWTILQAGKGLEGESWSDFRALCWSSTLGLCLPAIGMLYLGGWELSGMAAFMMLAPIAGYAPEILRTKQSPPMYARAVAKMKFGKYNEAETAIISELEKREDDFEGWMMLAELYATQFNDMPEAEQTVLEICDQPRTTPSQVAIALHRLADWYLKHTEDPEPARRALQMLADRMPHTHLARMALLRINQLPRTKEDLRDQRTPSAVPLPALGDRLDEAEETPTMSHQEAAQLANLCVEKLNQDPDYVPAREKLGRLLAENLGRTEQGIEQLTLLLDISGQPDAKRADWLATIAAWHLKYLHDTERAKFLLEKLIQEFPQSAQALAAQRRLRLLQTAALQNHSKSTGGVA